MTDWMGIKVGGLYKRTGRGSRGAPLLMVTAIEHCGACSVDHPIVTVLVEERFVHLDLAWDKWECEVVQITENEVLKPWPYKVVV
jgi:hypothetical protein